MPTALAIRLKRGKPDRRNRRAGTTGADYGDRARNRAAESSPHTDIDRTCGVLGAYVTTHALAVDAPIAEYYLSGPPKPATTPCGEPKL